MMNCIFRLCALSVICALPLAPAYAGGGISFGGGGFSFGGGGGGVNFGFGNRGSGRGGPVFQIVPGEQSHRQQCADASGEEAVDLCTAAVKKDRKNYQAYTHLGDALVSLGRYKKAVRAYKKALRVKRRYKPAKEGKKRAEILLNSGRQVATVAPPAGNSRRADSVDQSRVGSGGPRIEFGAIPFGNYHALVIGNDQYEELPQLETAVADATAVADVLRDYYGFDVKLLLNVTVYEIKSALNQMRQSLTEKDNLLIYYAGHGYLDRETDTGFWQPVDAEVDNDANWMSTTTLSRYLKAMTAKHIMVVADSCYSGTLLRAAPTTVRSGMERATYLTRMATKRARTVLTAGGLEPVLDGGGGGHSVFAKAFLDALRENTDVIDGQALFGELKRPVILNSEQTPQYSDIRGAGHDGGDFLFVRR